MTDKMPDEMKNRPLWSDGKKPWMLTGGGLGPKEVDRAIYNLLEDIKCLQEDAQKTRRGNSSTQS